MWIAYNKDIPRFGYSLSVLKPFHALLLTKSGNPLHDLIRDAEGPLHNSLNAKQMSKKEKAKLYQALDEIKEAVKDLVPQSDGKSYHPTGYFSLEMDEGEGLRPSSYRPPRPSPESERDQKRDPRPAPPNPDPRPNRTLRNIYSSSSRPDGKGRRIFLLTFHDDMESAELNLRVDENVDATCDAQRRDDATVVLLRNVVLDGELAPESALTRRKATTRLSARI